VIVLFALDIYFTNNEDHVMITNGVGITRDVINLAGVGVRQTSIREDEVVVTRVGVFIVFDNLYNYMNEFKLFVALFEVSSMLALKSPSM
jgi:hypothetical protein